MPKDYHKRNLRNIFFTTIFTIAFLIQIVLMFIIENNSNIPFLAYVGWIIWGFSLYFAFIPFITFKKRGDVEEGKSYLHTTRVVKDGPYAIIRHPQYLGGILFTISITLWNPVWFNFVLSIIIILLTYQWTYAEIKNLLKNLGKIIAHIKNLYHVLIPFLV